MTIDIIICTYNRPNKIIILINELLNGQIEKLNKIIVVDSSDLINEKLIHLDNVLYIHSSHKNQPYQRYLGFMRSKSKVILYLDDDMELINKNVFKDITEIFFDKNVIGLAVNFKDKNDDNSLSKVPISLNKNTPNLIGNFLRYISFNSIPKQGQIGLFGLRGMQPSHLNETTIISGGAFAARREMLFKNFNFQLFDLFEKKMGMGEDTLIGYSLSKKGKILVYEPIAFLHNDETGSNYSFNLISYSKRVILSRLYIGLEKTRLDNKWSLMVYFKFYVYAFFRLLGIFINFCINGNKSNLQILKGTANGILKCFVFNYNKMMDRNGYWDVEVNKDILNNEKHVG